MAVISGRWEEQDQNEQRSRSARSGSRFHVPSGIANGVLLGVAAWMMIGLLLWRVTAG